MRRSLLALVDALAVLVFAAIGTRSHEEDLAVVGVLEVAAPFLAGALVGAHLAGRAPVLGELLPQRQHQLAAPDERGAGAAVTTRTIGEGAHRGALPAQRHQVRPGEAQPVEPATDAPELPAEPPRLHAHGLDA